MDLSEITADDVVVIAASEDWPEHLFRVWEVHEDCITGLAITGPLAALTCAPHPLPVLGRVRSNEETDDEAIKVQRGTDHRHPERTGSRDGDS
jgi:hypothetical protein